MPSEPKDPIAPIASGKDACLLFGSLEQPVVGFQSARWQYQVKDCQSSACWDFFSLDIGCSLSFQHDNLLKTSKLDPALCRSAARVFISPRFIEATKACPMIVAPINESFEVEAATQVRRKFSFCETPDMQAARACLRWVAATAFGG
ncbi:MAG: hypothetical protein SF187_20005 [Deltaproteobacteria bacterium]|nr:hypothetical protein [Deltaproteobacteria bacterium]